MRLAVFGGTNRTKQYLLQRALRVGYSVSVLESSDETVRKRKNLTLIKGELSNVKSMHRVIRGADAALCILQNPKHKLDSVSRAVLENLIHCMQDNGVRRLVIFSCINTDVAKSAPSTTLLQSIRTLFTGQITEAESAADLLHDSGLDWTIVGHPPAAATLDRDVFESKPDPEQFCLDLAKCMVSQIADVSYLRSTLMVA